jgi:ATP-dependent protease ClpP protease subunit
LIFPLVWWVWALHFCTSDKPQAVKNQNQKVMNKSALLNNAPESKVELKVTNEGVHELYLFGAISPWSSFSASTVSDQLNTLSAAGVRLLNIKINSVGGDVFEANTIWSLLNSFRTVNGAEINVEVVGLAASAASYLMFVGGKAPKISRLGMIMVHEPSIWYLENQTIHTLSSTLEMLKGVRSNIIDLYEKYTTKSREEIEAMVTAETWMNADQALAAGFVSEITDTAPIQNCFPHSTFAALGIKNLQHIQNFINKNNEPMSTDKNEKQTPEVQNLQGELSKLKAESLVNLHSSRLAMTEEQRQTYIALAVSNYETTKKLLEEMKPLPNIAGQLNNGGGNNPDSKDQKDRENWSFDDWAKNDNAGLIELREKNKEAYNKLITAKYGPKAAI